MTQTYTVPAGSGVRWVDAEGNVLLSIDANGRRVDVPSGTTLSQAGTEVSSGGGSAPDPLEVNEATIGELTAPVADIVELNLYGLTTVVQTVSAQGGNAGWTLDLGALSNPANYVKITDLLDRQGNSLAVWQSGTPYVATDGKGSIPDEVLGGGFVWTCLTGGTSDVGEPDWSSPTAGHITDNDITWGDAVALSEYTGLLGIIPSGSEGQRLVLFNDNPRQASIILVHEGGVSGQELQLPGGEDATLPYHAAIELLRVAGGEELYWVPTSGGTPDPLSLAQYVEIGASPAQSGAVRLEEGGAIVARVPDYSAGSGMAAGDQPLIGLRAITQGPNTWDVLQFGSEDGPLGAALVWDPFWSGGLYALGGKVIASTTAAAFTADAALYNAKSVFFGPDAITLQGNYFGLGASGDYSPSPDIEFVTYYGATHPIRFRSTAVAMEPDGSAEWRFGPVSHLRAFVIDQDGRWSYPTAPTFEPGGPNQIWSNGGVLTLSAPIEAALTGTLADAPTEANVAGGEKTILLTLTHGHWVLDDGTFAAARQAIIDGLVSDGSETHGWNNDVVPALSVGDVVRTSDVLVTITLPVAAAYDITTDESITVTVPASATSAGVAVVATPTITVAADA